MKIPVKVRRAESGLYVVMIENRSVGTVKKELLLWKSTMHSDDSVSIWHSKKAAVQGIVIAALKGNIIYT
jgi:hypothetical protein